MNEQKMFIRSSLPGARAASFSVMNTPNTGHRLPGNCSKTLLVRLSIYRNVSRSGP